MLNVKKSRAAGFAVVFLVYIAAAVLGISVYGLLPYNFWLSLLIADVIATVFVFAFSLIFKNASVYDPYWSVQPIVIIGAYAAENALTLPRALILVTVLLWGIRLTANWAYTFHGLNFQDWRYTMLNEKTGKFYPIINFIGIHMVPTLVVYGCVLPAAFLFENETAFNTGSAFGAALSVAAFTMQGIADIQMHRFRLSKKRGETNEPFIRTGLWRYSRHPNYLGEILMWWGVAIGVVSMMPQCWYLCAGALANTCLFLFVSIPMADSRQSCKEGFEEYRKTTHMLLPVAK